MLSELCGGAKLNYRVNPDEAVAYGATILAAKECGKDIGTDVNPKLIDVIPQSIGVETGFGDFYSMLDKGQSIPAAEEICMTTLFDNQ